MRYRCRACENLEVLWNSSDSTSPRIISCRRCGAESQHVDWDLDVRAPSFKPPRGTRYFVGQHVEVAR